MTKSGAKSGVLALVVALLAALLALYALWTSAEMADAEREAESAVLSAFSYSLELDDLRDALLDAETGQRGYLLTGERQYLEPYTSALSRVESYDYADDEELKSLADMKMEELALTIRMFEDGNPSAALATVKTDRGKEIMDDIRDLIAVRQTEADLGARAARTRVRQLDNRARYVQMLLIGVIGLMILNALATMFQARSLAKAQIGKEEADDLRERMEVIAHELDHRMKNLFAVSQGLISQSARGRGDEVKDFASEVGGRLRALSQAYSVTRELDEVRSMPKSEIVDKVVRAQLLETHRFEADGDDDPVMEKAVTPLALILHEWTTNALKYGAWKPDEDEDTTVEDAAVRLSWSRRKDGKYEFLWDERHRRDGAVPERQGYGSRLVKMCASQLGGLVDYEWHEDGVRIRLSADPASLGMS